MIHIMGRVMYWLFTWSYFVLIICLAGACIGSLSHLLFGLCFLDDPKYWNLCIIGFSNGLRYGGVWAGGSAIVLCVMRARRQHIDRNVESRIQN